MLTTFRNSIQDGTKFCCPVQQFHPMISWKVCAELRIRESDQLKTVLELYDMEIYQKISVSQLSKIEYCGERGEKIRNFDYETLTLGTGELNREPCSRVERDWFALKEEKVSVTSGKKKASVRKETVAVSATRAQDRAQKPEHTAATLSEPTFSRGRRVSRKRSIRSKSNHGSILRQPCRYYLKDTLTRTSCEYLASARVPFFFLKKMKRVVRLETTICFRITRFMNNQIKSRKRATSQTRRESDDKNAVAIVKSVSQLGCVSQDSDALVSQGRRSWGNPTQKVLGLNSKSTVHWVYATSCEYSGKERTIVGKNKCQSFLISEVLTLWNWRTGPTKRLNDSSDVPEARLGILPKIIYKLKEKDKAAFYFPAKELVLRASSTKDPEEREFVVDSGASMHMVSKNDLNSAELEIMRTSKKSDYGDDGQRRGANKMKKRRKMSSNWTYSSKLCFLKKLPQFFPLENSVEDHGNTSPLDQRSQTTSHQKMARELIAIHRTVYRLWFLGLSVSSSSTTPSPTSSSSSSQDTVFDVDRYTTKIQYPKEVSSTSEELRRNPLHETTETETPK